METGYWMILKQNSETKKLSPVGCRSDKGGDRDDESWSIIWDRKKEAVKKAVSEAEARAEQEKADAINEVTARAEQEKTDTAQSFLRKGVSISNVAECTGLPIEKVRELAAAIA